MVLVPAFSFASNLTSVETRYFDVVGEETRSVSYVSELAEHIANEVNQFLPEGGVYFPNSILITLRPEEHVHFDGDSTLTVEDQGSVRLDFRWSETLTFEQTCYAITEAFLTRYALYQHGPKGPENMQAWPVHALALDSLYSLRAAILLSHLNDMQAATFIGAADLMSAKHIGAREPNFAHHAYLWLNTIRQTFKSRELTRLLIEYSIAGIDPSELVAQQVLPSDPTETVTTLELWWREQRDLFLQVDYELFELMSTSRAWIEDMVNFDAYRENGGELKNLRSLWQQREDPKLRELLEARQELIRLRIEVVNPIYYNAARSLGALFELALTEDSRSHEFMHTLVAYLGDIEYAKHIEEVTMNLLDK
ncbi:MAG TPA: hypothetical protein DCX06_01760 [Opitutae bacterium]|nr:hypothetical protein [Opitutae bacterium]